MIRENETRIFLRPLSPFRHILSHCPPYGMRKVSRHIEIWKTFYATRIFIETAMLGIDFCSPRIYIAGVLHSWSADCVQSPTQNQEGNVHHPEKESETFRTIWGSTTNYHFAVPRIHRQRRIVAPSSHVWCISVGVLSVDAVVGM